MPEIKSGFRWYLFLPVIVKLLGKTLFYLGLTEASFVILLSNLLLAFLLLYLIAELGKEFLLYSFLLFAGFIQTVGALFKIMHWPGSGFMLVLGLMGSVLTAAILMRTAIKNPLNKILYLHLILGLVIIIQFITPVPALPWNGILIGKLLNYPLMFISIWIFVKDLSVNKGERNLLIFLSVQSMMFVVSHLFELIK
ncbi:MAG: GldL-related protein [Cytophagaceae bacterium]